MTTSVSFATTTSAIAAVYALGLVGYIAVRRGILTHTGVSELARLLVAFILPCTLFNAMFSNYSPEKARHILSVGVAQAACIAAAGLTAALLHRLLRVRSDLGTITVLSSMQNTVYLPLPISIALLPAASRSSAEFYIGCFVVFFTPTLWSVGVLMLTHRNLGEKPSARTLLKNALNPPFVAALGGLLLKMLFLQLGWTMPKLVSSVIKTTSDATIPMVMVVLGGVLAEVRWSRDFEPKALALVSFVKLLWLPGLVLAFLKLWGAGRLDPVLSFVLLVESSVPAATNITLVAKRFGGNTNLVALTLFVTYLVSVLTVPLWLSLL